MRDCLRPLVLSLVVVLLPSLAAQGAETPDFNRDIAPLLARRCLDCHNATDKKGGLDLTRRTGAQAGGESGDPALAANAQGAEALKSPLWQRVVTDEMPPKRSLPAAEKALLKNWLEGGAAWTLDPIDPLKYSSDVRGGYDWWSFQPLRVGSPPTSPDQGKVATSPRSAIDAFIHAQLTQRSLTPSPAASRRVLIRRLSFDLIGLPPSPEEVAEFVADEQPDAYERLVDRLLASPHFGERWARHWLDVAHFGESDGFEYDRLRPNAWPYRDWVIRAMNDDLSYDQFVALQVAGDVLRPDDPQAVTATGFLVGGAFDGLVPAGDAMRQIMRQDELEDLVGIVGQSFLGLTVQCGRCHDHKFDPIRQTDYYRLASALSGVRRGDRPLPASSQLIEPLEHQIAALGSRLTSIEETARQTIYSKRAKDGNVQNRPAPPQPIAAWDFTKSLRDQIGELHATAQAGAKQDALGLTVDGQASFAMTAPLKRDIGPKTLAAVVQLANLQQQGGGVLSLQTNDGNLFDAIVYGEREAGRWMAGSNGFVRTQSFQGPDETRAHERAVHVAITYRIDGRITGYVDGKPYGNAYVTGLQNYTAGQTQVVFGLRHSPPGGNRLLSATILRAALYDRALSAPEVAAAAAAQSDFVSEQELVAELTPALRDERRALTSQLEGMRQQRDRLRAGRVYAITPQEAPVVHLLSRGSPFQKREPVAAGGIASVVGVESDFQLTPDAAEADRRRRLAVWLADPNNPLPARTLVNRLWHYHFGLGLVPTPNDLGFSGGQPSHPALLEWLAAELPRGGMSVKQLHRQLVTSTTYRQSSAPRPEALKVDADNRLLWRMMPRRLEAELVRDAILVVAGEWNSQMGGPGYQDFRPFLRGGTQFYEPLDPIGAAFARRSIYRTWARGGHNQLLDTFDCPDPSTSTPRRSVTTTPLQALSLLNNSFILRMADAFAADVARQTPKSDEQTVAVFRRAWGRDPQPTEKELAAKFVERHGLAALCRVVLNSNAFVYVE